MGPSAYIIGAGTGSRRAGDAQSATIDVPGSVFPKNVGKAVFNTRRLKYAVRAQFSQMMENIEGGTIRDCRQHTGDDTWGWNDLRSLRVYLRSFRHNVTVARDALAVWADAHLGPSPRVDVEWVPVDQLPSPIDIEARPVFARHNRPSSPEPMAGSQRISPTVNRRFGVQKTQTLVDGAFVMIDVLSDAPSGDVAQDFIRARAMLDSMLVAGGRVFANIVDFNIILADMQDMADGSPSVGQLYKTMLDEHGLIPSASADPRPTRTTVAGSRLLPKDYRVGFRVVLSHVEA